jgi:Nuclease-related domain/Topoisomerase DNA binding C4 zinc finger
MLLKSVDDKAATIERLGGWLEDNRIPDTVRSKIKRERSSLLIGLKNERDAAYYIDFHFGNGENYVVIHDLRIEENGRVAQIDHLLINRFMEFYVLESKTYSSGIAINAVGEFTTWVGGRPVGIASPIEQNARHISVLAELLRALPMPRRLGLSLPPTFKSFVLVSTEARITRGTSAEEVIKVDQFSSILSRAADELGAMDAIRLLSKVVSSETIETIGRLLVSEHRPLETDYVAKFGLAQYLVSPPTSAPEQVVDTPQCPRCGGVMVLRIAKKGENVGKEFWGCSQFPKCRGVVTNADVAAQAQK